MRSVTDETRKNIIARVFPELRYGEDPDISLYFDMRAQGRMSDALSIYTARLKPRYPSDSERVMLLKLYRLRSPFFAEFLQKLLYKRSDDIIKRIAFNIDTIISPLRGVSLHNTYAALKATQNVAQLFPDDVDSARSAAAAYEEYAVILDYKKKEVQRTVYLLNELYDQTSATSNVQTDFVAMSYASVLRRKEKEREKKNFFDLSKIKFDAKDIQRIEIPNELERDEDRVLAFCHKYWLCVNDSAFERIIWLYSKKYNTKHYEVFKTIRTGRLRNYPDDDILTMVGTALATRYSYTIQGDLYMQAAWRRIKGALYTPAPQVRVRPEAIVRKQTATHSAKLSKAPERAPLRAPQQVNKPKEQIPARSSLPLKPAASGAALKAGSSIRDHIKRLSGKYYDVHRDIFLAALRNHIHAVLVKPHISGAKVSGENTNAAENIIYDFMEKNYANAYMDWPGSSENRAVAGFGFKLNSLEPIIERCYKAITV